VSIVQHFILRGSAPVDRSTGRDGPVLLYTTTWQESKLVEHKRVP